MRGVPSIIPAQELAVFKNQSQLYSKELVAIDDAEVTSSLLVEPHATSNPQLACTKHCAIHQTSHVAWPDSTTQATPPDHNLICLPLYPCFKYIQQSR